jgi:hypothetical protein
MFSTGNIDVRLRKTVNGSNRSVRVLDALSVLAVNIGGVSSRVDVVATEWVDLLNAAAGLSRTRLDGRTLLCVARALAHAVERQAVNTDAIEVGQRRRDTVTADAELDEGCGVSDARGGVS